MLELEKFMQENNNWKDLLTSEPYNILIKEDTDYMLLKYNQLSSDFNIPLVRECRGIIFDKHTLKPVCIPFYKFGNYGESYVPDLDWKSACTQEKIDGSLIKVWYHNGKWRVSTNGTINAFDSVITKLEYFEIQCPFKSYGDIFEQARQNESLDFEKLNKNYTYMFELVSPYNKVVVAYDNIEIYHIGTRDNITLQELDIDIGIKKPKKFNLTSLEECVESAKQLTYCNEGYVVVDKYWNRVKVKSPEWVAISHLKNNGDISLSGIIQLIRENELGEFLTYFPEFENIINKVSNCIDYLIKDLELGLKEVLSRNFENQKEFALFVKDKNNSNFYFSWKKDNSLTPKAYIWNLDNNKIKELIKCKI